MNAKDDAVGMPLSATFTPLKRLTFAVLWGAAILGNIGGFMRDVASSWLATELSTNPVQIALVQVAAVLPVSLFAVPAGVLSDLLDRRRMLVAIQLMLAATSGVLLALVALHALTLGYLIALTFLGGVGSALFGPAWRLTIAEVVERSQLKRALTLNSLGINISRSVGPALGGLALVSLGAAVTYGADVASDIVLLLALLWWRRDASPAKHLPEQFSGAFRAGIRYARASAELRRVLARSAIFFLFASSSWALLPLIARETLRASSSFYGALVGVIGVGALCGGLLLPKLRTRMGEDGLVLFASLLTALAMGGLALAPGKTVALALMLALGVAWIAALTSLNGVAQSILPEWVRGRGLAVYLAVVNGAMAAGSLAWGFVAESTGIATALLIGAAGLVVASLWAHTMKLPASGVDQLEPVRWPEPSAGANVKDESGPVLVQITYWIRREDRAPFLEVMQRLAASRRRNGAYQWGLAENVDDSEQIIEWFLVESWIEHLRQHDRVTDEDVRLRAQASSFNRDRAPPIATHFIACELPDPQVLKPGA